MVTLGCYYGVPWPLVQGRDLALLMGMMLSLQHVNQWAGGLVSWDVIVVDGGNG